ncbi:hypothetical protein [Serratia sp. Z4]|uniref:hypothetical protein n=1 Tax=Serratia sp. Z4 TaxID=2738127 RepID=UPI00135968B4|nr:hypothetical protein [Serratia sp. Z4]
MDNKLIEPVAYMTAEGVAITPLDFESGSWGMHKAAKSDDIWCPLYLQEYVYALLAKLEAKSQRITGLERHVKDIEATLIAATDEIADLTIERDEARAKLTTPVRLPLPYSPDPWMSPDPDGTWLDKEDVKKSIRAAGFVVGLCSACNERYCGNCAHANGAKVQ